MIKDKIFENNILTLRIGEYFSHLYLNEDAVQKNKICDKAIWQLNFINNLNDLFSIQNYNKNKFK